jgi:Lar family restriction alleviation protein
MTDSPKRLSPVTETLKPCPFCGEADVGFGRTGQKWQTVSCNECGAEGPCTEIDRDLIIAKWNTRSSDLAQRPQQLQEAVAAAHAAFQAIPIGYPLQQNGRTIDHTLLNEAKRLCELAVSDTTASAAPTPTISGVESTVSRIMVIRNGMILDGDAKALIRKEIGALVGTPALQEQALKTAELLEAADTAFDWDFRQFVAKQLRAAVSDTSTDREGK